MGRARVVSVVSGKGGVGKSHLAVNVAALAAAAGRRVLLVDADGGLSNLDVLLGVEPTGHLGQVLEGRDAKDVIFEVRPGLWLLAGQPGARRLTHLDETARHALTSAWGGLTPEFDLVVVDVSSGMSDDTLFFASAGQEPRGAALPREPRDFVGAGGRQRRADGEVCASRVWEAAAGGERLPGAPQVRHPRA
jgi:flagellar biosynthesis protein FlhG